MDLWTEFLTKLDGTPNTQEAYDKLAAIYDEAFQGAKYNGAGLFAEDFFKLKVPKEAKILDLCCGTGNLGLRLNKEGYLNIDAVDGSRTMYEKAVEKGVKYTSFTECFVQPDEDIPLEKEAYDVILVCGAFYKKHLTGHHLPNILKLLKKGGLFGCGRGIFHKLFPEQNLDKEDFEKVLHSLRDNGTILPEEGYFPKLHKEMIADTDYEVWFARKA